MIGRRTKLSAGHRQALRELQAIADASKGSLVINRSPATANAAGWFNVVISLNCSGSGPFRQRERVVLQIPSAFPLFHPEALLRHTRFADLPHVYWTNWICLYLSNSEWDPSQGMRGFVTRLVTWFMRAVTDEADEVDQPLHPPVSTIMPEAGCLVITADAPSPLPWKGAAVLRRVHAGRCDLIDWLPEDLVVREGWATRLRARLDGMGEATFLAAAVLLERAFPTQFPETVTQLVAVLEEEWLESLSFIGAIALANKALKPEEDYPALALIGTPMRGHAARLRTHLAAWRLSPGEEWITATLPLLEAGALDGDLKKLPRLLTRWVDKAQLSWVRVHEQRPEIVTRRDAGRPADWLLDRRVLVLGCGALGAPIAEQCVRSGAQVTVADDDIVTPGILVRQPYTDADVGRNKAEVLAERLSAINPDRQVVPVVGDVRTTLLADDAPPPDVDLVVDATATPAVTAAVERLRWPRRGTAVLTVGVGHRCERGVAALSLPGASGSGTDAFGRFALAAAGEPRLKDVTADLFPENGRPVFQPEPGCSHPTFLGSASDVAALAGHLLTGALTDLRAHRGGQAVQPMSVRVVRLTGPQERMSWPNDLVVADGSDEIRFAREAIESMRAEAIITERIFGPGVETGGVLLGYPDDACRVVWVKEAWSPSKDSRHAAGGFEHGTRGVAERISARREQSAGRLQYVGLWHTHPASWASPSDVDDRATMGPALMVIVGGPDGRWRTWLNGNGEPDVYAHRNL